MPRRKLAGAPARAASAAMCACKRCSSCTSPVLWNSVLIAAKYSSWVQSPAR